MEFKRCYGCMRELDAPGAVCPHCGFDNTSDPEKQPEHMLKCGTVLNGRYTVGRSMGQGGFGITYAAIDEFGERVAIKEFFMRGVNQRDEGSTLVSVSNSDKRAENEHMRKKFRTEAMRLRGLKNEHIVKVLAFFEENGTSYYVMNFIDGESLSRRMDRLGGLVMTEQEVRSILNDMLDALDEVHHSTPPLYHLDIKPGNIMVDSRGSAYLIDFGSSKQTDPGSGTSSLVCIRLHTALSQKKCPRTVSAAALAGWLLPLTAFSLSRASSPYQNVISEGPPVKKSTT